MPTYAILGSTGNCGTALTKNLLKSPDNKINAYCRNVAKLHRLVPEVVDNKNVQVFSGKACVRDTQAVFMVATTNDNIPGCRISQDSAAAVIAALTNIKAKALPGLKLPTLVLLSPATIDPYLSRDMPSWFHPIMLTAAPYVYEDLIIAEKIEQIKQITASPCGFILNPRSICSKTDN